ncbi:MAG: tetratricopeptide repeat protein [Candidatus Binatia bacterium]
MKIIGVLFAAVLSVAWMPTGATADDRGSPEKPQSASLEAGRKAVDAKDFKSAVGHLIKAAKETPNDADVHNLLGYSYRHQGQFEKSMEHYRLALKLDPNHRGAHEYIGELYLQMDQLANAEKQMEALSRACPWFGRCREREELKAAIEKHKAAKK